MKKNSGFSIAYFSPAKLFLVIAASIFIAEAFVMMVLPELPSLPDAVEALLDAAMLVVLVSPFLYLFLFRPLILHITEREKVEETLTIERDRAQSYLDVAGVIIIALDEADKVILINKKGCEILGYEERDVLGKNWFTGFVPEGTWGVVREAATAHKTGTPVHPGYFENPVITRSGEERHILWRYTPLVEEERLKGILYSGEDITERKRMEKALIESEMHYRLVHNTAFDGIITSGADDRIMDCNPGAENIFGYERGELAGVPIATLMPPRYRQLHHDGLKRFLDTGKSRIQGKPLELEGLKKDGTVFPIELILSFFYMEGSIRFSGTIRDITERKRAEKEREIMQARINQSQKIEAIGRLAGGIAHDFNNILTTIEGSAELAMEDAGKNTPVYPRLEEIILSVRHASKLTRQLLLFSREHPVKFMPLNINTAVEDVLLILRRVIGEDIKLVTELTPDVWMINADEAGMEQVLLNLAVNARDAMPDGGTLFIKTGNVEIREKKGMECTEMPPGRYVSLQVSDTGAGMERDVIQRIFEPFFTTKDAGKGTGLGLSVVYGIVKRHGGCVTVDSAPDKGAAFTILLPEGTKPEGEPFPTTGTGTCI